MSDLDSKVPQLENVVPGRAAVLSPEAGFVQIFVVGMAFALGSIGPSSS